MKKSVALDILKETVTAAVKFNEPVFLEAVKENRISISIGKDLSITVKAIELPKQSATKQHMESEDIKKVKEAKKVLKNNLDSLYLFTLLVKLDDTLKKTDLVSVPEQSRQMIKDELESISNRLRISTLLLYTPPSKQLTNTAQVTEEEPYEETK